MFAATITSKGQITIPAQIRNALNLGTGDRIAFSETSPGSFAFQPVQKTAVTALKGMFGKAEKTVSISDMKAAINKRGAAAK
jgi:antitoxin PrlF